MGALDGLTRVSQTLHGTFGRSVTLRRVTAGSYDPATLSATDTTADTAVSAVFDKYRADELVGPIQAGDLKCTIHVPTSEPAPDVNCRVVDASTVYSVVMVDAQYATDEVAYYELALRR